MPQSCRRKKVRRDKARPQSGREPGLVRRRTAAIMRAPPPLSCFPGKPANGFVPAAVCRAHTAAKRVSAADVLTNHGSLNPVRSGDVSRCQRFHAARTAHRRRHHCRLAGVNRSSVHKPLKARRRNQRRIHDQRRARYRTHLCESKQHLYMGRVLRGKRRLRLPNKQQSHLTREEDEFAGYRCFQGWNEDFRRH